MGKRKKPRPVRKFKATEGGLLIPDGAEQVGDGWVLTQPGSVHPAIGLPPTIPGSRILEADQIEEVVDELERRGVPEEALRATYDGSARQENKVRRTIRLRPYPIAVGIPFDEMCYSKWVINMFALDIMPWDDMFFSYSTYLDDARNIIHRKFVEESERDWLFMLDSDVLAPPDTIRILMSCGVKMVGGWYKIKYPPYSPVVYDMRDDVDDRGVPLYRQRSEIGEGLEAVDGAGAGCWLMNREIAEALGPTPYHLNEGGEDLLLCRKVHELGYETHIHWSVACAHAGVMVA